MKEMDGTEEFLDLDVKVKKCQNEETVLECKSKTYLKYLDIGKRKCGCIPHHLRNFYTRVIISLLTSIFTQLLKQSKIKNPRVR